LEELELDVPGDVSVIGYDENELAFVKAPRMTVIGRQVADLGRIAGRLAIARLANPDGPRRTEVVETRLVVHESSGRVAAQRPAGGVPRGTARYATGS
jgi:LacI family transcriptional regulator